MMRLNRVHPDEERRVFVERMLRDFPLCQACIRFYSYTGTRWGRLSPNPSTEVHERKKRSQGGDILDRENCVAVCDECHRRIHENPALSYQMGLLIRRDAQ